MSIMCAEITTHAISSVADEDRPLHHHVLRVQATAVVRVVGEEHVAGRMVSPWRSIVERTACVAAPKWN